MKCVQIKIYGIVQGVGFRPFIYSAAKKYCLTGFVLNDGKGVIIEFEGDKENIANVLEYIKKETPRGAFIEKIEVLEKDSKGYKDFIIKESVVNDGAKISISPDLGICRNCKDELQDQQSRFYEYPFISCSSCGPRFSIMEDLPYDRLTTSMRDFGMCPDCANEYKNPSDRRYHAQTIACQKCGPKLSGLSIEEGIDLLNKGKILAIKGIGGYHIACDAQNDDAVSLLRKRKVRPDKPFAVMMNIEDVEKHCYLSEFEKETLESPASPIILLKQKNNSNISKYVNPGVDTLGVMLPYTGLHKLLLEKTGPLVMTSGNISNEPIIAQEALVENKLSNIIDGFIHNDRRITNGCDDSVIKCFEDKKIIIRRSRGFVPTGINLGTDGPNILACGGDLKNTFCIYKDGVAYLSQYIGDLISKEASDWYVDNIDKLRGLLGAQIKHVICDYHPMYQSAKYAQNTGLPIIKVQHHHAHIASVLGEHNIYDQVIGVAFDGTGYGDDGTLWGGEFFIASRKDYQRLYHFEDMIMPGGESAINEPWKMGASYLYHTFGQIPDIDFGDRINPTQWKTIKNMIDKDYDFPKTSSVGRLFDGISSIIGIRDTVSYEGQAAIELEAIAYDDSALYTFEINDGIINVKPIIVDIVHDLEKEIPKATISAKFHNTLSQIVQFACQQIHKSCGIKKVVLSGGVFQNTILLSQCIKKLQMVGFQVYYNNRVPINDGGLSLGQLVVGLNNL